MLDDPVVSGNGFTDGSDAGSTPTAQPKSSNVSTWRLELESAPVSSCQNPGG